MIFITGIAGFVGSNLANRLHSLGRKVSGCDNLQFGYSDNVNKKIKWVKSGFENIEFLDDVHTLVHCATANIIYAQTNQLEAFKINGLNTIRLFQRFKGKIIYTSTASVYGNSDRFPIPETAEERVRNAYDQSKLTAEYYLRLRGNYTTLRLSNVYGKNQRPDHPYSGVIGKFVGQVINGKPLEITGDGLDTRDFTYIDDVVNAIIKAIDLPAQNTEINIGSGTEMSIINLAHLISELTGYNWYVVYKEKRKIDGICRRWMRIDRAKELLNWKPEYSITEGINKTINELSLLQAT